MNSEIRTLVLSELKFSVSRSSGPGGQNVNKVNSKVTVRWSLAETRLRPEIRDRIWRECENKVTASGEIIFQAEEHREQSRNKEAAVEKILTLLEQALRVKKRRRATKPKRSAKEKRLNTKRIRSKTKTLRRSSED